MTYGGQLSMGQWCLDWRGGRKNVTMGAAAVEAASTSLNYLFVWNGRSLKNLTLHHYF